jgi:predicted XRE-type DNA-binding protein
MRVDPIPELKRQLGDDIARALVGYRSNDAADLMETDSSRVADLRHGKLQRFSLETLVRFATRLRRRVTLNIEGERESRLREAYERGGRACRCSATTEDDG